MNERIEVFLENSLKVKIGYLLGIIFFLVFLYWFFFYSAKSDECEQLIEENQALNFFVLKNNKIVKNLPLFEAKIRDLNIELKKALAELPDKKEIPGLLQSISSKAKDSGLDIKLFQPLSERKKDFYAEVPVQIETYGTFHQVAKFFDEVGHLERIVNLDEFSITNELSKEEISPKKGEERSEIKVKAIVLATSFRFLDESERPKKEKKGKRRKKGRRKKK